MLHRSRVAVLVSVVGLAGLLPSCSSDDDSAGDPAPTTTAAPSATDAPTTGAPTSDGSETTAGTPETTSGTPEAPATTDRGDWTGERYDFGSIESASTVGNHVEIRFDRQQLYSESGELQSGAQFTDEPIVTGNTDAPMVNDNPSLRRFVLAADAEVLRVHLPQPCADGTNDDLETTWDRLTAAELVDGATEVSTPERVDSFTQVALTFDATGLVTRVRLGAGC